MIIYKITNLVNQKVYIGQTKQSLEKRWSAHKSSSNCIYLAKAIKKHSVSNFKIEQIDSASNLEDLNKKEEYWISFFNSNINGYNLTSGGDSRILSEKSKQKMSDSRKGKIMTENTRLALQNCNANKIISEEEKI